MTYIHTSEAVEVVFEVGDERYRTTLKPFEIVHDGIHHAIPEEIRRGHRLVLRGPRGEHVYPDMFAGEVVRGYGDGATVTLRSTLEPISASPGTWRNIGFDHLAIAVEDRKAASHFFGTVLQMQTMRDDEHLTVLSTGHTALFLFDTGEDVPMSDGLASRWHHIGFVVDDLEHAFHHLREHEALVSDFTLLERQERWSLYGHYRNGETSFMIQLSEIREGWKGLHDPDSITEYLYDYSGQRYGKRLEE